MKLETVHSPEIDDASTREATGKTFTQWFAALDAAGGVAKGRRELTSIVHAQIPKESWWATTIVVEYERARGQKEKDGKPTGYSICSTKTIAAPPEAVFAAFGDAVLMDRWLGPKTRVDFRDGGTIENGDGDSATIVRIRPGKDLRLAWNGHLAPRSAVEVLFADKGQGRTGITLNHTRIQSRRESDRVREGWAVALDSLKKLLEKG